MDDGDRLTVTWGREHYQPIQFHGFDVGPFALEVTLREGETVSQATARAQDALREIALREFEEKLREYLGRVREMDVKTREEAAANRR